MMSFIFLRKVKLLEVQIGKAKPIEELIYQIGLLEKFNKKTLSKN
jgi:hypothetical protein